MELRQGDYLPSVEALPTLDESGQPAELATPLGVAVVTQCCDLARGSHAAHVSPVVELTPSKAAEARSGKTTRFGVLGPIERFVDFSVVATLPMPFILKHVEGRTELPPAARRLFAAAFSRRYSRFGFPDYFVPCLKPLQDYVRSKANKPGSPIYPVLERVVTIRVEVEPHWESAASDLRVNLAVVVPSRFLPSEVAPFTGLPRDLTGVSNELEKLLDEEPHHPRVSTLWDEFADSLAQLMRTAAIQILPGAEISSEVTPSDGYSLERYLASYALDLDDISDR